MWRKIDMKTIIKYELVINEALKIVRKDIAQIIPMNGVRKELSLKSMPCRTLIWM